MYLALSYDHRIIDGKESVGFLLKIKEALENPIEVLMIGDWPDRDATPHHLFFVSQHHGKYC